MSRPIEDYLADLEKYYDDKSAGDYDSSYSGEGRYRSNHFRLKIILSLLRRMTPRPVDILEAGCGDARVLLAAREEGYDCRGFDRSAGMRQAAGKRLTAAGQPADVVVPGDIYAVPFPDASFDVVVCVGVIENLPEHARIFSEFRRVLRPGGRLILSLDNQLFSLFSANRHTLRFFADLHGSVGLPEVAREYHLNFLARGYDIEDAINTRKRMEDAEIDKTAVQLEAYNPLNVKEKLAARGFTVEELRFFHVHPLPPRFEREFPALFRDFAESLETADYDWRGAILCNAMLVQARA